MGVHQSWKGTAMQDANLTWRKSTRSGAAGHCVEVANVPSAVLVRDSKDAGFATGSLSGTAATKSPDRSMLRPRPDFPIC